jgi:Arc/MetJ-type ribon-helix-helix transcriptional regulator
MTNEFTPEQQERIKAHTRARGMMFEVFLPEELADWLRSKIAAGIFENPGEAAFVAFQDLQALDRHPDARRALLTAMIEASINDSRPGIPAEEFREQFLAQMREDANTEPPAPARSGRRYKTGRNQQINIKATPQVIERLYKIADARRIPLGELLEQALDALEKK